MRVFIAPPRSQPSMTGTNSTRSEPSPTQYALARQHSNACEYPGLQQQAVTRSTQTLLPTRGTNCSGLLTPDTHLGENARHREVSDDQATPYLYP